jgi:chemotaxis protein methyltransferase CheR
MPGFDQNHAAVRERTFGGSAPRPGRSGDSLFDTRIGSIAQLVGASPVDEFVDVLRVDGAKRLHRAVTESIAIHDTSFFRDHEPFQALRTHVLPALIAQNRPLRRLALWSAGCSTGQEPYSLAMLLLEDFPETQSWDVRIVGTDIAPSAIAYAERARYRAIEVSRGLPTHLLHRLPTRRNSI